MQIHELRPKNKFKKRKRVGRGGKRGTYSGRGMKGQKARSGTGGTNLTEKGRSSWVKRFPKLGGFSSVYLENIIVKTSELEKNFKNGDRVDWEALKKAGLVENKKRGKSGRLQEVKILNNGTLNKKLIIAGLEVSKSVKKMIEEKGGKIEGKKGEKVRKGKKIRRK
ncbi:MAG: uL15 family ribosomal protein [Patescibacteria group bacterium]|nr:uL15 family ribosomal protein [Patescibacteria group bacterium]